MPDLVVQPCAKCGAETKNKRDCPACHAPVVWRAKSKPPLESSVKETIRAALVAEGCMVRIHNVDARRGIGTGLGDGTPDLVCIVPPHGRFLGVEVKRPGRPGLLRPSQIAFGRAVRQFGGVWGVADSVKSALALLAEARQQSAGALPPPTID